MDTIGKRLFTGANMAGSLTSDPIDLNNMVHLGVHAVWTGTPAGDLILEVSGQIGQPTVWEVFDTVAVAGTGSQYWIDRNVPYRWARIRYAPSGGSGSLSADAISKGDR